MSKPSKGKEIAMLPCFIELPTPCRRQIWSHFDSPENPDNFGFIRCKSCYTRFPANLCESEMINHLKGHESAWTRFFDNIESKLNNKYNGKNLIEDDERKKGDLKLSNGLFFEDKLIIFRLPKSRTTRKRFSTERWKSEDRSWNRIVAEEYQNNQIGSHQGNFDRPISDKKYRCGNTLLTFSEFVTYRHEPVDTCMVFDINREKYEQIQNKDKINAYKITTSNNIEKYAGPAALIDTQQIVYSCVKGSCEFPCLCKACVLNDKECQEHIILHPNIFDPVKHFFIVRNADDQNINYNEGKITYSNSLDKGYEMIYDVYKYAGILKSCDQCTNDMFHHQAFHFVYHDNCKFCRASKHRFEGIRTHIQFLNRFEEKRYKEEMSCHICYKIFSSVQSRDVHVKSFHEKEAENQFGCELCDKIFSSRAAIRYHVEKIHGERKDLKCGHCEKVFALKQNLDVHIRSVHKYRRVKCEVCEESFTRQSNLTSHYRYVHDVVDNYLIMDDGIEVQFFECENCQFESRYEKNLRKHIKTVHNEDPEFRCPECDYVCNRMDNLYRHLKLKHEDTSNTIKCNECEYTTKLKYNLDRHMDRVHNQSNK